MQLQPGWLGFWECNVNKSCLRFMAPLACWAVVLQHVQ